MTPESSLSQWYTAFFVVGLIHVALPLVALSILYRKHDRRSVALWCSGSLLFGLGTMLISLRETHPAWLSFTIGGALAFASYPIRCAALRRELGLRTNDRRHVALWIILIGVYVAALLFIDAGRVRVTVSSGTHLIGASLLTALAWRGYRRSGFRSAALLAVSSGAFALSLLLRVGATLLYGTDLYAMATGVDFFLTLVCAFVAAFYGNLGYIGIALETSRDKELQATAELAREHERLLQTELRLREQTALHEERAVLLSQREEMLGALAHEVRQPLNNALAALTSATHAIETGEGTGGREEATARLRRANAVLTQVNSALDNTLADAVLLAGTEPVSCQDIDLDMLLDMAVGDIDPCSQIRIRRERDTATRTASMNAGLMRLALRNVVANAIAYSPPDSPVVVRIVDSDEPLAIVFEVLDLGPGIDTDLLPRLFTRGARGSHVNNRLGHGLGLHIVRRVMELHGGEAAASPRAGGGLTMRLVVPQ